MLRNKNCHVQDEDIEGNKDFEDVEKIGRKGGVLSRNIGIPPFHLMLAQHIMLLLKGLAGQVILPSSQPPYNPPVSIIVPMLGETIVNDAFFHPLLVSVVTQNMHGMLTMFLKLNPLFFLGSETNDNFEFILNYYVRLYKLGMVYQHVVEFVPFKLQFETKK